MCKLVHIQFVTCHIVYQFLKIKYKKYIFLQGCDVGNSRMDVRPAQGGGAGDFETIGCRSRVDGYATSSGCSTSAIHRLGIACT